MKSWTGARAVSAVPFTYSARATRPPAKFLFRMTQNHVASNSGIATTTPAAAGTLAGSRPPPCAHPRDFGREEDSDQVDGSHVVVRPHSQRDIHRPIAERAERERVHQHVRPAPESYEAYRAGQATVLNTMRSGSSSRY
jgi:hypothetical protein